MKENIEKNVKQNANKKSSETKKWVIKITLITFCISILFGVISQITITKTTIYINIIVLIVLMVINIFFDGIAIAVTACDPIPLYSMASKKIKHSKNAIFLVKNAAKVSSICADVIGDVSGIISGACGASISLQIVMLAKISDPVHILLITVAISAIVSAITVGGKAAMKGVAIKYSQRYVLFAAKVLSLFRNENKRLKNKNKKKNK